MFKVLCSKIWNFSDACCNIKLVCNDKQAEGSIPLKFQKCPGSHVRLTRGKEKLLNLPEKSSCLQGATMVSY